MKAALHRLFLPKPTVPQNLNTCLWLQRDHVHNCLILYLMSVSAPYKMSHVCNDQVPIASSRMYLLKDQAAMVTVKTVFLPGIWFSRDHVQAASLAQNICSRLL